MVATFRTDGVLPIPTSFVRLVYDSSSTMLAGFFWKVSAMLWTTLSADGSHCPYPANNSMPQAANIHTPYGFAPA